MNFKTHLIAICIIILTLFVTLQAFQKKSQPLQSVARTEISPYQIIIVRASYGLNCLGRFPSAKNLFENNVKDITSKLCEGKLDCRISVNDKTLDLDSSSECPDKEFEVDYRCFSFDRLRSEKASFGQVELRCSNLESIAQP